MLTDARSLEDGTTIDAAVCVVGAGAAGLATALPLLDAGHSVVLAESGGLDPEPGTAAAGRADGALLGHRNRYLQSVTRRGFGALAGTRVGARSASGWPLEALEMAPREWVAGSGWPLGVADLAPFVTRAAGVLGIEPTPTGSPPSILPPSDPGFATAWLPFTAGSSLAPRLRRRFAAAAQVEVLLHATAVAIELDGDGARAVAVAVRCAGGPALRIRAGFVVLAAGTLENARLLLQSDRRRPGGLGNTHDQVGRGFKDQVVMRAAHLVLPGAGPLAPAYQSAGRHAGAASPIRAVLRPTAELQRRHELLGSLITLETVAADGGDKLAPAVAGLARCVAALDGGPRAAARHHLALALVRGEQTANAASRLRLRGSRDSFGRRRIDLRWELTDHDLWSLRTTTRLLGEALGRHHAGRLQYRGGATVSRGRLHWAGHPSGTTRMSRDPASGVVDPDCRLHDVDNVFVAGASVFPTGGCCGPLLTEVALGLRLGEHLRSRLAGE